MPLITYSAMCDLHASLCQVTSYPSSWRPNMFLVRVTMTACVCELFHPDHCRKRFTLSGWDALMAASSCLRSVLSPTNITCGNNGCNSGSVHIIATKVKYNRVSALVAGWRALFRRSLRITLPLRCVKHTGTGVSSKFTYKGCFPVAGTLSVK